MAKVVFTTPEGAEREVPLLQDGSAVTVGRHPSCQVVTHNPSVSRKHAEIVWDNGRFVLRDLGSSNGTFVGEKKITRHALTSRRVDLRCGDFPLVFVNEPGGTHVGAAPPAVATVPAGGGPGAGEGLPAAVVAATTGVTDGVAPGDVPVGADKPVKPSAPRAGGRHFEVEAGQRAATTMAGAEDVAAVRAAASVAPDGAAVVGQASATAVPAAVEEVAGQGGEVGQALPGAPVVAPLVAGSGGGHGRRPKLAIPKGTPTQDQLAQLKNRIDQLERDLDARDAELVNTQSKIGELKVQLRDKKRAAEGESERVHLLEEELGNAKRLLEESRSRSTVTESDAADRARQVKDLEDQLKALRDQARLAGDEVRDLKVQVVHKDHQLEEMQRALAEREYDLNRLRDELSSLEEQFSQDTGTHHDLETKLNDLRDVIEAKENEIVRLQRRIEEKDQEIWRIKQGEGYAALEEERRDLALKLVQGQKHIRELEEQLGHAGTQTVEKDNRVAELEKALERAREEIRAKDDIRDHPLYLERTQEVERLRAQLSDAKGTVLSMSKRLVEFSPEEKIALVQERDDLRRRLDALASEHGDVDARIQDFTNQIKALRGELEGTKAWAKRAEAARDQLRAELDQKAREAAPAAPAGPGNEQVAALCNTVGEGVDAFASNVRLMRSYLRDLEALTKAFAKADAAALPDVLRKVLGRVNPETALGSVKDLLAVLVSDSDQLTAQLTEWKGRLQS